MVLSYVPLSGLFGGTLGVLAAGVLLWNLGKWVLGQDGPLIARAMGVITAIIGALLIFGSTGYLWILLLGLIVV